jgi:hypothetical protein
LLWQPEVRRQVFSQGLDDIEGTYNTKLLVALIVNLKEKNMNLKTSISVCVCALLGNMSFAEPLFNGKDLSGWEIVNGGQFSVDGGLLRVNKGTGWLRSVDTFGDFKLTMEFRFVEKGANSGIFVRTARESNKDENGWPSNGYQLQALDSLEGPSPLGFMIPYGAPPFQHVSNLKALESVYQPAGFWHVYEIECVGETLSVRLNGELITLAIDVKNSEGHIGIQAEHGILDFRRIEVERF